MRQFLECWARGQTAKTVTPYSGARLFATRTAKMGTALTAFPLGRAGAIFATRLAKGVTAAFCRRGFCSLGGGITRSEIAERHARPVTDPPQAEMARVLLRGSRRGRRDFRGVRDHSIGARTLGARS